MDIERSVEFFVQAYTHLQSATTGAQLRTGEGLPCVHFSADRDQESFDEGNCSPTGLLGLNRSLREPKNFLLVLKTRSV
jgi:hypothetical protein